MSGAARHRANDTRLGFARAATPAITAQMNAGD